MKNEEILYHLDVIKEFFFVGNENLWYSIIGKIEKIIFKKSTQNLIKRGNLPQVNLEKMFN